MREVMQVRESELLTFTANRAVSSHSYRARGTIEASNSVVASNMWITSTIVWTTFINICKQLDIDPKFQAEEL